MSTENISLHPPVASLAELKRGHFADVVCCAYRLILNREPESAAIRNWVDHFLGNEFSHLELLKELKSSEEATDMSRKLGQSAGCFENKLILENIEQKLLTPEAKKLIPLFKDILSGSGQ